MRVIFLVEMDFDARNCFDPQAEVETLTRAVSEAFSHLDQSKIEVTLPFWTKPKRPEEMTPDEIRRFNAL